MSNATNIDWHSTANQQGQATTFEAIMTCRSYVMQLTSTQCAHHDLLCLSNSAINILFPISTPKHAYHVLILPLSLPLFSLVCIHIEHTMRLTTLSIPF